MKSLESKHQLYAYTERFSLGTLSSIVYSLPQKKGTTLRKNDFRDFYIGLTYVEVAFIHRWFHVYICLQFQVIRNYLKDVFQQHIREIAV